MGRIRAWRIRRLKVQLASVLAEDRVARDLANKTRICYPYELTSRAGEIARLEAIIRQLESDK